MFVPALLSSDKFLFLVITLMYTELVIELCPTKVPGFCDMRKFEFKEPPNVPKLLEVPDCIGLPQPFPFLVDNSNK